MRHRSTIGRSRDDTRGFKHGLVTIRLSNHNMPPPGTETISGSRRRPAPWAARPRPPRRAQVAPDATTRHVPGSAVSLPVRESMTAIVRGATVNSPPSSGTVRLGRPGCRPPSRSRPATGWTASHGRQCPPCAAVQRCAHLMLATVDRRLAARVQARSRPCRARASPPVPFRHVAFR